VQGAPRHLAYDRAVTASDRLKTGAGTLLRIAVVALATHAVVYHALLPADGDHGYFGWYAPLVAGLSVAALLGTLGVLAARATGIGSTWVPRFAAMPEPSDGVSVAVSRLAGKALAFLVMQETLERSLPARSFEIAQFSPFQWLVVLAAITLASTILVSASRGRSLLARRLSGPRPAARAAVRAGLPVPRSFAPVAGNPLASFRGLRAPPASIRA
jgi:hypothetical protein